jgi:hypothetical protein
MRALVCATALIAIAAAVLAAATAGAARADLGGVDGANLAAHFYDCSGPPGTPQSFDAVRQTLSSPWHLLDSSTTYSYSYVLDETTNTVTLQKPGNTPSIRLAVTCTFVGPISGHTYLTMGFFGTG